MYDPQKVIDIALAEVGYKEKSSLANLFDKLLNPGNKNYNKYAQWMDANTQFYNGRKQGVAWCAVFVHWCFCQAYGVEAAQKMLFIPNKSSAAGVRYFRDYFIRKNRLFTVPIPGDVIFYWPKVRTDPKVLQHTGGPVYAVDSRYVYTVEGNVVHAVKRVKHALNEITIAGYGRPNYNLNDATTKPEEKTKTYPELKRKDTGVYVSFLQSFLNAAGATLKVDGIFGPKTQTAVKQFQKARGITADGVVGAATWALLKAVG